ncbi:MAG: glycine--tRNA ligase subunit beta [Elusimicrobiota bacterium]|nr:glycine--tRNA ligase subunit beta [Elusimicrobiota bacterium]
MSKDAILEIYSEEIPARFFPDALEQLKLLTENTFNETKLGFKSVEVYATPRRLVVYIEELEEKTPEETTVILGPPLKIAKDKDGKFTEAAIGFANSQGVNLDELAVKKTAKGDYICIEKKHTGTPTEKILPEIFKKIISEISFPKSMRWEESGFRFARPVRNILALYGNKVIKLQIADVKSTNFTFGLSVYHQKKIKIPAPEKYFSVLKNNCIIVNQEERKEAIIKAAESLLKKTKLKLRVSENLLNEINFLVEYPSAVLCKFDERYLSLPEEIVVMALEKNHKFFPVIDENNKLTNFFVGIRNGISEGQEIVREGFEQVLTARLQDVEFFYQHDLQSSLESKAENLKGIVFHEKLGSIYDKVQRITQLSEFILNELIKIPEHKKETSHYFTNNLKLQLQRAALLCKADIATEMAHEYPELEGMIGRRYALSDGESQEVATAIEEHYMPITPDGQLPVTPSGIVLSLADKTDTIVGDFAVGLIPTGSADPYGLRRQATGILRILLEKKLNLSLESLIKKSMNLIEATLTAQIATWPQLIPKLKPTIRILSEQAIFDSIFDFLRQRLETIFEEKGYRFDEIRAVLAIGFDNIADTELRLQALHKIHSMEDFQPLIIAYKRAANILKQAEQKRSAISDEQVVSEKLIEPEEKKTL